MPQSRSAEIDLLHVGRSSSIDASEVRYTHHGTVLVLVAEAHKTLSLTTVHGEREVAGTSPCVGVLEHDEPESSFLRRSSVRMTSASWAGVSMDSITTLSEHVRTRRSGYDGGKGP